MKQIAMTTTHNGTSATAITFIAGWVKKYSFLYAKYSNWHICITNDVIYNAALNFDVCYATDCNATAQGVLKHFKGRGMHTDGSNDTGRYLYLHKKYAL